MPFILRLLTPIFISLCLIGCSSQKSKESPASSKVVSAHDHENLVDQELVNVALKGPRNPLPGSIHPIQLKVMPQEHVANVVVHAFLSEDANYERSEPAAAVAGRHLTWTFEKLMANEEKELTVWISSTAMGDLVHCATVEALPLECISTLIGKPELIITKKGPESIVIGRQISYPIEVRNIGGTTATNVVLTDRVPEGLEDPEGRDVIELDLGDLGPGESFIGSIDLLAAGRGKVCNEASANAENATRVSDKVCTIIQAQNVDLMKSGPSRAWIGRDATYQIIVRNSGDTSLSDLKVVDTAPSGTKITKADGGSISGSKASWKLDSLDAANSRSFFVTLEGSELGERCNEATVTTAEGINADATFCTVWEGHAALLLEVIDTKDPLIVGESTTYEIVVKNQGTGADHEVYLTVDFSRGLLPTEATGAQPGEVSGKSVRFNSHEQLDAGEEIRFTVKARATAEGEQRVTVLLFSNLLQKPVMEEESTHVY